MRSTLRPASSSRTSISAHWFLTLDHRFAPVRAAAKPLNNYPRIKPGNYSQQHQQQKQRRRRPENPSSPSSDFNLKVAAHKPALPDHQPAKMGSSSAPASSRALSRYGNGGRNNKQSGVEVKRKQRIASYNAFAVESQLKASVRSGIRWMKNKYNYIVYGY